MIFKKSDLPISLRPFRTSPLEEKYHNTQIPFLLANGLIKQSNNPYSALITFVINAMKTKILGYMYIIEN